MRVTFTFAAYVQDPRSGEEVHVPDAIHNWQPTLELMGDYLDPDLVDFGIVGGEIHVVVRESVVRLQVVYWLPQQPTQDVLARLQNDTAAQFDDGMGEGGFPYDIGSAHVIVTADTASPINVDVFDDGRIIPKPSSIAIAARDGDLPRLRKSIVSDPSSIDALLQGYSGLHLAIVYGHLEAVRDLIAAGADSNRLAPEGSTPLELCALTNSLNDDDSRAVAQLLLEAGANPNHTTMSGDSVRTYAEIRGKFRMLELL